MNVSVYFSSVFLVHSQLENAWNLSFQKVSSICEIHFTSCLILLMLPPCPLSLWENKRRGCNLPNLILILFGIQKFFIRCVFLCTHDYTYMYNSRKKIPFYFTRCFTCLDFIFLGSSLGSQGKELLQVYKEFGIYFSTKRAKNGCILNSKMNVGFMFKYPYYVVFYVCFSYKKNAYNFIQDRGFPFFLLRKC